MSDNTGTQALWPQMISALAAIDRELGLPDDGCNSTALTLDSIRLLHMVHRDDLRAIAALKDERYRLQEQIATDTAEIARLRAALDDTQAEASVAQIAVEALRAVALGTVQHVYRGDCTEPDRPEAFDPECPACVAIKGAVPARQPLTDEQMLEALDDVPMAARAACGYPSYTDMMKIARAIEFAHGIGSKP